MQFRLGGAPGTYVGEENAWNTSTRMLALFVALVAVISAAKTSLMASHRILMSLDTSIDSMTVGSKPNVFLANLVFSRPLAVPSEGKVRG